MLAVVMVAVMMALTAVMVTEDGGDDGDGDLVDELMDALTYLTETGPIWVLTPKLGRAGHVESSDIQDAAPIAGLSQTSTIALAQDWAGTRLVARKVGKR